MSKRAKSPKAVPAHGGDGQLRIIAGQWRSRQFNFPMAAGLRPTPNRVRETLFNWLAPYVEGAKVLDLFVQGAQKAGPNLSTDSFIKAMDSLSAPPDLFGGPAVSFSATKRLGNATSRLSQIQDGRWKPVSDYIKP